MQKAKTRKRKRVRYRQGLGTCFCNRSILGKAKVQINETQLAEVINTASLRKQMENAIEVLKDDFTKHLSLRSTTGKSF